MADQSLWALLALAFVSLKEGRLPPGDVIKLLISKGLGLGIVAGSTMVKLPQVATVVKAQSAEGLSPLSFELETLGLMIAATYGVLHNLAFSAYGESMAMLAQNIVLLLLIYRYQKRSSSRSALLFSFVALWGALFVGGSLKPHHLDALYDINNLIMLASRLPQIVQNFRAKSTGKLSLVTYSLNVAGATARIFTTLQEKNAGTAMLRGAVLGTFLNGIMVAQIIGYGSTKKAKKQ